MRILHLAFEDHRRPGSGGGSLRNREVNTRLAEMGHDIEVITANYPGARPRVESGVRYRQRGVRRGYAPSLLSHQVLLPSLVAATTHRFAPDIIVEEFAPLTSSLGVGYWTDVPTVGVAQGFFAAQKAREYHLPVRALTAIQRWGTRSHHHLIAVSEAVAAQLRAEAPAAHVSVIANGVDLAAAAAARAWALHQPDAGFILFLGRLEIAQKGLDVLISAMTHIHHDLRLVIAGEGKDRDEIRRRISQLGLDERVDLIGPVQGTDKWRLLASATMLVQPSRYETFGISPLEAMACATPVVASALPCLRELVPDRAGILVVPEDARALSGAVNDLASAPELRASMADAGPPWAARYGWDAVTESQLDVYRHAVNSAAAWVSA
jgi:glycogen(starch) synthase